MTVQKGILFVALIIFSSAFTNFAQNRPATPSDPDSLSLDVSFEKKNVLVDDIKMDELRLEGKSSSQIVAMEDIGHNPLRIAFLVDISDTQRISSLDIVYKSWRETMRSLQLRDTDYACLISFNHDASLELDFTSDKSLLLQSTDSLKSSGATALYDALYLASLKLGKQGDVRKAIILLTDGIDSFSRLKIKEAYGEAAKNNVRIYMFLRPQPKVFGSFGKDMRPVFKEYVEKTGGKIFTTSSIKSTQDPAQEIFDALNHLKRLTVRVPGKAKSPFKLSVLRKGVNAHYPSSDN